MSREDNKDRDSPISFKQSLYGSLAAPEDLEKAEKDQAREEAKKKKKGFYFWVYRFAEKHFVKKKTNVYEVPETDEEQKGRKKKKKSKELQKDYKEALDFLGWKLDPRVVMAVPKAAGVIALIIGILIAGGLYLWISAPVPLPEVKCKDGICDDMRGEDSTNCPEDCDPNVRGGTTMSRPASQPAGIMPILVILAIPVALVFGMMIYIQKYPLNAAEREKMRALTYVPEIINYMVMQMRLQPNLERAVEFASEHGEGKIAEEFKEVLWRNRIGIYETIEEGLDEMAYRWEPYSEEFKHAITLVRSSVLLPDNAERNRLYDEALKDLLSSTKDKMEFYTRSMKQPSLYLFYLAILLPLMIIIMLPVAGAFAKTPWIASIEVLSAVYLVALPLVTYVYAKFVLAKRPGGYVPPDIPDDYPGLPRKGVALIGGMKIPVLATCILLFIVIMVGGYFLEQSLQYTPDYIHVMTERTGKAPQSPVLFQYYVPIAIAAAVGLYLYGISIDKLRAQDKVMKMELDFKDAMYLVASRLAEKKPLEDALGYVKRFMPESKVATELLENVQRNVMVLGLTLTSAIFDPVYGAVKYIPSRLIKSAFKIMTDSIELGPEVASASMMAVSDQIRNVQKINDLMRKFLDEVTSMMSSMATFVGPIILGMVSSLQGVIMKIVPTTGSSALQGNEALSGATSAFGGNVLGMGGSMEGMASPLQFQTIIAFYVILLVIILSYFTGKVRYGDNKTAIMVVMGRTIPIAICVFAASLFAGQTLMAGMS